MYAHLSSIRKRVLALHNSHTKLHSWKVEAKVTINHPRHWRVCHYRDLISWRNGHWQASCSKCYDLEQVLLKTTIYHHHHHQPVSGGSRDTWRVSTVPWMVSILNFLIEASIVGAPRCTVYAAVAGSHATTPLVFFSTNTSRTDLSQWFVEWIKLGNWLAEHWWECRRKIHTMYNKVQNCNSVFCVYTNKDALKMSYIIYK